MANKKITDLAAATTPLSGNELLEVVQSGSSAKATATSIANTFSSTLGVANGGTGATTLTGYVKGSGTSAMTAAATIPYADVAGRAYISAYDSTDQTGSVSAATAIKLASTSFSSGITIANNGSGDPTRITFAAAGTYMLAPSIQFKNTDTNDHDATIWFRKNGTDIANSATITSIPKAADGGAQFFQIVIYEQVTAGQYIEIMWLPENVNVTVDFTAAGAIAPAIPSVILASERIA
jgi:hypothetical protein